MKKPVAATILAFVCWVWVALPTAMAANCCDCRSPNDPKNTICITTAASDCAAMPGQSIFPEVKKLTCTDIKGICKKITDGVCVSGPTDEKLYKAPSALQTLMTPPTTIQAPKLGVPIPGLTFTPKISVEQGFVNIPWTAEYISAAYRYLAGVAVIAASVMIVYGGFKYIVSSSGAGVQTGKDVIADAIVGLLIILGAYTILWTINPATVQLHALGIPYVIPVTKEQLQDYGDQMYKP